MNSDKKNPVRLKWKSDIINWDQLSNEAAVFVVQQGETVLNECVETARTISAKADRLISILLPLTSAIMIYLISGTPLDHNQFLKISRLLILMVMFISLWYCYKNFKHYQIAIPGLYPKDMLTSRIINTTVTERQNDVKPDLSLSTNFQLAFNLATGKYDEVTKFEALRVIYDREKVVGTTVDHLGIATTSPPPLNDKEAITKHSRKGSKSEKIYNMLNEGKTPREVYAAINKLKNTKVYYPEIYGVIQRYGLLIKSATKELA